MHALELELAFKEIFPASYDLSTYKTSGDLDSLQEYNLDYFRDYNLNLRLRRQLVELYLNVLEKRQKSDWEGTSFPLLPVYSDVRSDYEDINLGLRYLSLTKQNQQKTNLSKLKRSLLQDGQINIETELGYKNGELKRASNWFSGGAYIYDFLHKLKPHYTLKLALRYGLNDDLELESGLSYTTPLRYKYEYELLFPAGQYRFIKGTYKLRDNFYFPLKLSYRPKDNFSISFSSNFSFINQRLDYWFKDIDDSLTVYPSKELSYYNTKPEIRLSYLYDAKKQIPQEEFSVLTKQLLLKNQCLFEFRFQKDITHLSKSPNNGPQNILDPYNVFLYPLEYFVAGSEYATFFCGNISTFAGNVFPQNYNLLELGFIYGLSDYFNLGLRSGYLSSSSLHHFTLGSRSDELRSRFYKFRSHLYFDFLCDWQITKNSLLSLKSHFVPNYKTLLNYEKYTGEFESENRYFAISLAFQMLF